MKSRSEGLGSCLRWAVSYQEDLVMNFFTLILSVVYLLFLGCSDEAQPPENKPEEGALERSNKISDLERDVESLRWENTRLALKIKSIDGASMVFDKQRGLWHHDVDREPFTGLMLEKYPNQNPRAEAGFLKGKKDGMERFWHPNGVLRSEGKWFDGMENGVFRDWDEKGKMLRMVRYKNGQMIENLME